MSQLVTADLYDRVREAAEQYDPAALITILEGPSAGRKMAVIGDERIGSLGDPRLDQIAFDHSHELMDAEKSDTVTTSGPEGSVELFYDVYPAPPTLIIFGAVHVAQPLTKLAKMLGYRVLINDARAKLATDERFPEADEVIVAWPDEAIAGYRITRNTYIAILTHDPKFDEPALVGTLETRARYIGAVGSRKTNRDRRDRLRAAGVSEESLSRIRGPIGLNIGASTPEEMAVSIMAEIIAVRKGREGGPLTEATGSIRGETSG
jgi:xanthine dehydrogenase accessory factor